MRSIGVVLAAFALAPAAAAAPHGFHVDGVRCAVGLGLRGLVCASPAIHTRPYDGRGVVQLLPSGRMRVPRSGSDVLLAIDRASDGALVTTLRLGFYDCARLVGGAACIRRGHGFFLSNTVFRRF